MRSLPTLLLALSLAHCGADEAAKPQTCTREGTAELVAAAEMSKLLAAAVNEETAAVLMQAVAAECCRFCPGGAADRRPRLADAEACITCAAGYPGGDPAAHVTGCSATVCDAAP